MKRCAWPKDDPLMCAYHDTEWGVPLHDDRKLFEFVVLDSFQAGLSWATILKKREHFRKAFDDFNANTIQHYSDKKIASLMQDTGIVRNKLKIVGTIKNARTFLNIQDEFGSFDVYLWQFVNGKRITNKWKESSQIPTSTKESDAMSKDLKKRGCTFVGTTICYAFMQGAGLVNDHVVDCFRYKQV